ncbi:hypothetical protein ACYSNW_15800 [Enterococcus sp. LJL99]
MKLLSAVMAIAFFANAFLHVLLILGYPLGEFVPGGKYKILPKKMKKISGCLIILWLFIGLCYLSFGKIIKQSMFNLFDRNIIICATLFLFCAIFSNGFLTKSKKERLVMTPFCVISFIISIILLVFNK